MTSSEIIDKILSVSSLGLRDQNDLAIKCGINPNTLTVAVKRDTLSSSIVQKIHDKFGVSRKFLKEGTGPVLDESFDSDFMVNEPEETFYKKLVESNSEYRLVPKSILDGEYRIMLKNELEANAERWREIIHSKNDLIAGKNDLIAALKEQVKSLQSK